MSIASTLAALRAIPLPMMPVQVYDADDLREVLDAVLAAINAIDPDLGGGGAWAADGTPGLDITLPPYSAPKDGTGDCSPILTQAITDGFTAIWHPAGRYRYNSKIQVPTTVSVFGSGPHSVTIDARDDYWLELNRATAGEETLAWSRTAVGGFTLEMTSGGIRGHGNEIRIGNMRFKGGVAAAWCVELHASNDVSLIGLAGGDGDALLANGVRVYAENSSPENVANYGRAILQDVAFRGAADNWIGVCLEHLSTSGSGGAIAGAKLTRVRCKAPAVSDTPNRVAVGSGYVYVGSIGLKLNRAQRCHFDEVDASDNDVGIWHGGDAAGIGASDRNLFTACAAERCRYPWIDTTGDDTTNTSPVGKVPSPVAKSSARAAVIGGNGVGPVQPTGDASGDPSGTYNAKRSSLDWLLAAGLWFPRAGSGPHRLVARASQNDHLYLTTLYQLNSGVAYDSAPQQLTPRKAIGFDVISDVDKARIYKPRGYASGAPSRLVLGNGQGFTIGDGSGGNLTVGPLQAVEVADPLYLAPWTAAPDGLGVTTQNAVIQAASEVALGSPTLGYWWGPGLYALVDDATQAERIADPRTFVGLWAPVAPRPGLLAVDLSKTSTSYTLARSWFGKLTEMGNSSACTITVPADLLRAEESGSGTHKTGIEFELRRGAAGAVTLSAGSGVTIYVDGSTSSVSSYAIPRPGQTVKVRYVRTGSATATVYIAGGYGPPTVIALACSDETTAVTTGTAKATFRMPFAMRLTAVKLSVTTAPTGSTLVVDINESGTTILSTKLSVDASEKTSATAATAAVISDSSLADDAEITVDFDQVGSSVAGAGVKVYLIGYPQ